MQKGEIVAYQKKEVEGAGEVLGNKLNFNYKGSNKCPDGYYWVSGYNRRVGRLGIGKVYVAGHCRKVGTEEIEDRA